VLQEHVQDQDIKNQDQDRGPESKDQNLPKEVLNGLKTRLGLEEDIVNKPHPCH